MATEVKLPDVLEGVQDVTINRWLIKVGDSVKQGQPILEVATEKVDTQVDSPADGTVLALNFSEGEIVNINASLALIGSADEKAPQSAPARAPEKPAGSQVTDAPMHPIESQQPAQSAPPPSDGQGAEETRVTPVARRVAEEEGVNLSEVKGSGSGGQVTKEDVLAYKQQGVAPAPQDRPAETKQKAGATGPHSAEAGGDVMAEAVPLSVQRLAVEHNIDLREVADGRPLGTLSSDDVLKFLAQQRPGQEEVLAQPRQPQWQVPTSPQPAAPAQPQQPAAQPQSSRVVTPAAGPAPAAPLSGANRS